MISSDWLLETWWGPFLWAFMFLGTISVTVGLVALAFSSGNLWMLIFPFILLSGFTGFICSIR